MPISKALRDGDHDTLRGLLRALPALANKRLRAQDQEGLAPLHVAIALRDAAAVGALLDAGADPNAIDAPPQGNPALSLAAAAGLTQVCELLVQAGADPQLCSTSGHSMPPLPTALFEGHPETARFLAERVDDLPYDHAAGLGRLADIQAVQEDSGQRWSALLYACKNGQLEVVKYLVPRGIDLNIYPSGSDWGGVGASGMHWAAHHGHQELALWLLEQGTPPGLKDDSFGGTAADWAAHGGHMELARTLIRAGVPANPPLLAGLGMMAEFKLLLETEPDWVLGTGEASPLRSAAWLGAEEMVRWLVSQGADPALTNPQGLDAVACARAGGHEALARWLQDQCG